MKPKFRYIHVVAGQNDDINELSPVKTGGYVVVAAYPTPQSLTITYVLGKEN